MDEFLNFLQGEPLTLLLIHTGSVLTAMSFLLRDILWLRILAICANVMIGVAAYRYLPEPRWEAVAWSSIFASINVGHSIWLIYERHMQRFTEDEQRLFDTAFQALDKVQVRKLFRSGEWKTFDEGGILATQGAHSDYLVLICTGEADVRLGERVVRRLGCGKFVGEIGFVSRTPATATVVAAEPSRCLIWDVKHLRKLLARKAEIRNVFHAAIGQDLAEKLAAHNVNLSPAPASHANVTQA